MKLFKNRTFRIILMVLIGSAIIFKWFLNNINEYYSENWISESITESKSRDIFLKAVDFEVDTSIQRKFNLDLEEVWIEQHASLDYYFLFFSKWVGNGEYRLCFKIKDSGDIALGKMFVPRGEGHGFMFSDNYPKKAVYWEHIGNKPTGQMRVSFLRTWSSRRTDDIIFRYD